MAERSSNQKKKKNDGIPHSASADNVLEHYPSAGVSPFYLEENRHHSNDDLLKYESNLAGHNSPRAFPTYTDYFRSSTLTNVPVKQFHRSYSNIHGLQPPVDQTYLDAFSPAHQQNLSFRTDKIHSNSPFSSYSSSPNTGFHSSPDPAAVDYFVSNKSVNPPLSFSQPRRLPFITLSSGGTLPRASKSRQKKITSASSKPSQVDQENYSNQWVVTDKMPTSQRYIKLASNKFNPRLTLVQQCIY